MCILGQVLTIKYVLFPISLLLEPKKLSLGSCPLISLSQIKYQIKAAQKFSLCSQRSLRAAADPRPSEDERNRPPDEATLKAGAGTCFPSIGHSLTLVPNPRGSLLSVHLSPDPPLAGCSDLQALFSSTRQLDFCCQ